MIPGYNRPVQVPQAPTELEPKSDQQLPMLQDQITQLRQTVEYLQREHSRLKSDIQTLAQAINRMQG